MIKTLKIKHFRGFYQEECVEFALPNGKAGSGITLLVGPNNTGKTTVIEALLLNNGKKLNKGERHGNAKAVIIITDCDKNSIKYTNVNNGSGISVTGSNVFRPEPIAAKRSMGYRFNGKWSFNALVDISRGTDIRNSREFDIGPILKTILEEPQKKELFDKYMKGLIPHFTDWTIDTEEDNGNDYIEYKTKKCKHKSYLLGDGVISLFRIVAHLIHEENTTLIIDEPELSLHPAAQKRLSELLSDLTKSRQIILSTHSTYFFNWNDFVNGAQIIRFNKAGDEKCTSSRLESNKDYGKFIDNNILSYQKPHLLDVAAKEILFSDNILFLEGQEDVGLIKKWLSDNNIPQNFDIFGYGVGGETNIKLFLEMAKDLNILRVGAIYDKNTQSYKNDKKNYPDYLLLELPTNDIRDKDGESDKKKVEGIFNQKGVLKDKYNKEFRAIMENVIKFLSP